MKHDSWLYSDSFLKRAFAIWGYHAVANLIIAIPFAILWGVLAGLFVTTVMRNGGWDEMMDDSERMMMDEGMMMDDEMMDEEVQLQLGR